MKPIFFWGVQQNLNFQNQPQDYKEQRHSFYFFSCSLVNPLLLDCFQFLHEVTFNLDDYFLENMFYQ